MGQVNITIENGGIGGTLQTNDGIAGLIVTGVAQGSVTLGEPRLLSSLASLTALGVTQGGNALVYKQVKEFYDEAGSGALLYLLVASHTVTLNGMASPDESMGITLLDYANGRIKFLGLLTNDVAVYGEELTITNGLNEDVYNVINTLDNLIGSYVDRQKPLRGIVGATSYTGVPADLNDLTTRDNNRVAVLLGDTVTGDSAAVGMLLGRLAKVPVQRKVSRVRDGALSNNTAYMGTSTVEALPNDAGTIAANGFITWATYPNVSGYFFSGDDTASGTDDDYHALARGRVIDKAHRLAYATFVQEVDDEVAVNEDGTLDAGFCKWLSQQIVNQINNTMTVNKEISSVVCIIDPTQNILSTEVLNVQLRIVPVGYATEINISLGFRNPAA